MKKVSIVIICLLIFFGASDIVFALTWGDLPIHKPIEIMRGTLPTELGTHNTTNIYASFVLFDDGIYKMWYGGQSYSGANDQIHYAESSDGLNWTKKGVVLDRGMYLHINDPSVVKVNGTYYIYYTVARVDFGEEIHMATSSDGMHWQKYDNAPVFNFGYKNDAWDYDVGRPSVIYENGTFKMWYDGRRKDENTLSWIGYATSTDGFHWERFAGNPVFGLDTFHVGRESQIASVNVRKVGNQYIMVYQTMGTGWAASPDGIHWKDKGILIPLSGTNFDTMYHATPKIFIDGSGKATAIYMSGVSIPTWDELSIGVAKLEGDEFTKDLPKGDIDQNGVVDIYDYNILVRDFGRPYTIFDYNQLVGNFGK